MGSSAALDPNWPVVILSYAMFVVLLAIGLIGLRRKRRLLILWSLACIAILAVFTSQLWNAVALGRERSAIAAELAVCRRENPRAPNAARQPALLMILTASHGWLSAEYRLGWLIRQLDRLAIGFSPTGS